MFIHNGYINLEVHMALQTRPTSTKYLGSSNRVYSGRNIAASFSYVTQKGEGKMERARGKQPAQSLSEHVRILKTFCSLLILTESMPF
jgi:hypothetical protein